MKQILIAPVILCAFFLLPDLHCQQPSHHQLIEELLGELMDTYIPDMDPSVIYDDLLYYTVHPLNINTSGAAELAGLHFIDELRINNLLDYRRAHGYFMSVYELLYVDGFTAEDLRKLMPFITVGEPVTAFALTPSSILRQGNHQVFLRLQQVLQKQRGYLPISDSAFARNPNSRYPGSPLKIYNRYQFNHGRRIQAGFVAEKDQGEEFFRGSNPRGFDYHTVHLQVNDAGKFKTIALGDFQAGFGQGLVLWSGLAFGKSASTLNIRKSARGIQKYSSTDENMFFRGAGVTYRLTRSTESSFFLSRKKVDAAVSATGPDGKVLEVSSLQTTGLHATPSQLAGRKSLGETVMGGNVSYNHDLFRVGATVAALKYDAVLNPPVRIYNQFEFRGSRNLNGGADYQFAVGPVRFFGEGAVSSNGGTALLTGGMANLSSKMSVSALYRNYARDYHALFGDGFRENTRTSNEKGFYLGTLLHLAPRWKLSAYVDFFSFPWMRYNAWAPSSGSEYFIQLDFNYSAILKMYASFRHKDKPLNSPAGANNIRVLYDAGTSRLRYHTSCFISPVVELRNRLELSRYTREDISPERGMLLYQDILYKPRIAPFSLAFRFAAYRTDSYNARFYAYENDVLYAFSIPAYYDNGYRTYLLGQYSAGNVLDIWIKYGLTKLPGRESMGSGLNEIAGDARSELKAQVRVRF
jgi:hypothetical protein